MNNNNRVFKFEKDTDSVPLSLIEYLFMDD